MELSFMWGHIQVTIFACVVNPNNDSCEKSDYRNTHKHTNWLISWRMGDLIDLIVICTHHSTSK